MGGTRGVVLTGLGLLTPLGADRESSWDALIAGKSAVSFDGGRVPLRPEGGTRAIQLALAAAREAWAHAGHPVVPPERVGCVVSSSKPFPPVAGQEAWRSPEEVPAAVARSFGVQGMVMNLTAACATGAQSLLAAAGWIAEGRADLVLAGASESALHPLYQAGFRQMGVLSKAGCVRPFDRNRDGFLMGEGAAVFVVESFESAFSRGVPILAWVMGGDVSSDAHHATRFNSNGDRMAASFRRALGRAGVSPKSIGYVNAHGTGTVLNDSLESKALLSLFGNGSPPISSTKGATGHLLGATGAVELGFTLLAIRDGLLPPTLNLDNPETDQLDFVPNRARRAPIRQAASLSFGFGGALSSVVLGHPQP
jgi:3-oxoacyl-[acyl-carrier-protein] synthase II